MSKGLQKPSLTGPPTSRITTKKLAIFNRAVQDLYAAAWSGRLPQTLPGILSRLLPGEMAMCHLAGTAGPIEAVWIAPDQAESRDRLAGFLHWIHLHPERGRRKVAHCASGHLLRKAWHRAPLYREILAGIGLEDDLGLDITLRPGLVLSFSCLRTRWTFEPEERGLIDLLGSHVRQAWVQARRLREIGLTGSVGERLEETEGRGIVRLDETGQVLEASPRTLGQLERFAGRARSGSLPPRVLAWFRDNSQLRLAPGTASDPLLRLAEGEATLQVRLITDPPRGYYFLILQEEAPAAPDMRRLRPLGLSQREEEVLYWVAQGKTNQAVAQILGISDHTVKRHLENIYSRLQVDGRHAASCFALQYLRGESISE